MNKEKWKERMAVLKEKLAFLKPWDMDEDRKMTWKYRNFIHSRILPGALMRGKQTRDGGSGPKRSICGAVWQCWRYWWQAASISITAAIRLRNTW